MEEIKKSSQLRVVSYESRTDLTKWSEVENLKEKEFDQIVHLAGVVKARLGDYPEGFEANVTMTGNIIRLAKAKNIKRIIFISSNSVNYRTDDYAESKRKAEKLLIESGLDYIILRPTLILGSAAAGKEKLKKILGRVRFVPLPNGGKTCFSPIYPEDLARLIVKVIKSKNTGIYTVGGERLPYWKYLENTVGKKLWTVNIPSGIFLTLSKILGITTAKGMVEEIPTDNEKLKEIYEWEPNPPTPIHP